MAEKESKFTTTVESLFKGMDSFISAKTVVGDVVTVNDTIIAPAGGRFFWRCGRSLGKDR